MKKFWYVHNRKMGNPTFRHETKDEAIKEALRLSKLHNKNFYVLESVCKALPNGIVDETIELD